MKPLIIFHAHCSGELLAPLFRLDADAVTPADYVSADHGFYPTVDDLNVDGREIFILDFSFPRKALDEMRSRAKSVVILDHHKTAEKTLAGFPGAIFDMTKSGAVMAWEYFHPGVPVPQLLQRVEDRDIWRWALLDSAAAMAYLDTRPFDFEVWDELARSFPLRYLEYGRQLQSKLQAMAEAVAAEAEPKCSADARAIR